jgi:hypothetical protein
MCDDRHRHQEWLKFLRVIDEVTPPGKDLGGHPKPAINGHLKTGH